VASVSDILIVEIMLLPELQPVPFLVMENTPSRKSTIRRVRPCSRFSTWRIVEKLRVSKYLEFDDGALQNDKKRKTRQCPICSISSEMQVYMSMSGGGLTL